MDVIKDEDNVYGVSDNRKIPYSKHGNRKRLAGWVCHCTRPWAIRSVCKWYLPRLFVNCSG